MNNKFARALVDETFYDVLLNLEDIYTRYKTCRTELKTSGSLIDASHCAVDQKKMQEVLEFDSNFKIMSVILTYDETGEQEECPKRQDGLKLDFKCHSP